MEEPETDAGPGDSRSIENPQTPSDDAPENEPVRGETPADAGSEGEKVSDAGEGLVPEEGVNEPGTKP